MDLTISIPDEVASKLKERAAVTGQSVPDYTSKLIVETVAKPTLDELLAPVRADFANTGMNEDELLNFGRDMINAARKDKKAKST